MNAEARSAGVGCDLWLMLEPAEDLPGQWVSHCLSLGLVSQGDSPHDALLAILE